MKHRLPTIDILGVPIVRATVGQAIDEIQYLAESAAPALVIYVNAHTMELSARDPELKAILQQAAIVLNDGIGLSLAARIQGPKHFLANLNGTDVTPMILHLAAAQHWRVYLLGAAPGVAEKAAAQFLEQVPGLTIAGTQDGFFPPDDLPQVIEQIRAVRTDLLIVGMGNPKQEKWLAQHLISTGARLGIGVGAFLDFSAGVFPRAPTWMQNLKIEWLFRMSLEPRRLWKRYLLGGPVFLGRVAWQALRSRMVARSDRDPSKASGG